MIYFLDVLLHEDLVDGHANSIGLAAVEVVSYVVVKRSEHVDEVVT